MTLQIVDFEKCSIAHEEVEEKDLKSAGSTIYEAFANIGFVYLKNTGIADEEAAAIRSLAKQFFQLDYEAKIKYAIDENAFGYVAPGGENANPNKPGENKHVYDINGDGLMSEKSKWPHQEIPEFSKKMRDFMEKLRLLATRILNALSLGMNVKDKEYFRKCHSRMNDVRNMTTLRTLHYPVLPESYQYKEGEMRLGEHTDWGSFTILFQDFVGGLQVKRQDGQYIEATPIPGTALINIGDALQYWTRGKLKSTEHRIPMPKIHGDWNVERNSLVYFIRADHEAIMSEIEYEGSCNDKKLLRKEDGKTLTVLEHLQKKYREANLPVPS